MKLISSIALLLLSSSTLAYDQQEITQIIKQQTTKTKLHYQYQHKQNTSTLDWEALHGPQSNNSLHIVPLKNNNTILFAYHRFTYGDIYKSIDGGQHWKSISSLKNREIHDLISIDENHLLLAAGNQIYFSNDQGKHWILSATIDDSCDKLFSPNPNLILLATNHNYTMPGLYRSTDHGHTFTPAKLGIDLGYPSWGLYGRDHILLTSGDGIFISTNNGALWTQPSANWAHRMLWSAAIDSQHNIFLATGNLYKTDISGQVWEKLNNDELGRIETVKIDSNDRLYVIGKKDGLFRSKDKGKTWGLLHKFKQITDITLLDNGKILVSTDEGLMQSDESQLNYTKLPDLSFSTTTSGHAIALDKNHFFATASQFSGALYASDDAGKTWRMTRQDHVIDVAGFDNQVVTLEYSDKNKQILFSNDLGRTWQSALQITAQDCHSLSSQNGGLMVNCKDQSYFTQDLLHWNTLNTIAQNSKLDSYFSGTTIYITDGHSIKKSGDHGLTWASLLDNLNCYKAYISGYKDEILVIAISGAGVIKMTNEGKIWDLINDGLMDYDFSSLVVIDRDHYFVATDDGIFSTKNGGKHWVSENRGLNNFDVLSLSHYQNVLLAGTNGSGVFKAVVN